MRICIYPKTSSLQKFTSSSRNFGFVSARLSRLGTAELCFAEKTEEDIQTAFAWIKRKLSEKEISGIICYTFVNRECSDSNLDPTDLMHTLCDDVSISTLDKHIIMVSGTLLDTETTDSCN